jgi:HTH-type transcriptional regulator/antitoxin HipB
MYYTAHTAKQLGQTLRSQRKLQKLTLKNAASSVGLLPKTITRLELTTDTASIESLYKLLSALDLELVIRAKPEEAGNPDW